MHQNVARIVSGDLLLLRLQMRQLLRDSAGDDFLQRVVQADADFIGQAVQGFGQHFVILDDGMALEEMIFCML